MTPTATTPERFLHAVTAVSPEEQKAGLAKWTSIYNAIFK